MAQRTLLEKAFGRYYKALRLCGVYGLILTTPAKEIKRMKLRQIEKDLKALVKEG